MELGVAMTFIVKRSGKDPGPFESALHVAFKTNKISGWHSEHVEEQEVPIKASVSTMVESSNFLKYP
jgi:hypothetical protein